MIVSTMRRLKKETLKTMKKRVIVASESTMMESPIFTSILKTTPSIITRGMRKKDFPLLKG